MVTVISETLGKNPPKFHAPFLPFLWIAIVMETVLRPIGVQPPLHRRRLDFFKKNLYFSNDKTKSVLDFISEAGLLKRVSRSGWSVVGIKDAESVADHLCFYLM